MLRYTFKRFMLMFITLWVITTATFFLMHSLPGGPFKNEDKLLPEIREQIKKQYGLDKPVSIQYLKFLGNLVQGDLGRSITNDGRHVTQLVLEGFPASAFIGAQGLIFGSLIGLTLGIIAALYRGKLADNIATITAVLGVAVPSFVVAALLSYYVGVVWGILPSGLWDWNYYQYSILPSLSLGFPVIAVISRYVRAEMVEVLDQDYMKTAKAKGLSPAVVVIRHGLRNALIPAITILGPLAVNIITGSLIIERIFAIPGMGEIFVKSIQTNDYTSILGTTIFYSALIIFIIFVVDILYGVIDPRIRVSGVKE